MTESVPYSEAEFYRRRDDRTETVLEKVDGDQYYQNATLFVTADPNLAATYAGQICLLTTANMLSRFARDVDLCVPDVAVDPSLQLEQTRLDDWLLEEMRAANPFGAFDHGKHRPPTEYDGALVLGNTDIDPVIRIDASGWLARVTRDEHVPILSDHH